MNKTLAIAGIGAALLFAAKSEGAHYRTCSPHEVTQGAEIVSMEPGDGGVTLWVRFQASPFPLNLSAVFVPDGVNARRGCVGTVIHFHGHLAYVPTKIVQHDLRAQLANSGKNAILVVPQQAILVRDSSEGQFSENRALSRFLSEIFSTLTEFDSARFPRDAGSDYVMLTGHSGAYRVIAKALEGDPSVVDDVVLFDSLYANVDDFAEWIETQGAIRSIRFVNTHLGGDVWDDTRDLLEELRRSDVPVQALETSQETYTLGEWVQASQDDENLYAVRDIEITAAQAFPPTPFPGVYSVDMRPSGQRHTWLPLGVFSYVLEDSGINSR